MLRHPGRTLKKWVTRNGSRCKRSKSNRRFWRQKGRNSNSCVRRASLLDFSPFLARCSAVILWRYLLTLTLLFCWAHLLARTTFGSDSRNGHKPSHQAFDSNAGDVCFDPQRGSFVRQVFFTDDGATVGVLGKDGILTSFDATSGARRTQLSLGLERGSSYASFAVDSAFKCTHVCCKSTSPGRTNRLEVWNVENESSVFRFEWPKIIDELVAPAVSPEGKFVTTVYYPKQTGEDLRAPSKLRVAVSQWDISSGQLASTIFVRNHALCSSNLVYSPDGSLLAHFWLTPRGDGTFQRVFVVRRSKSLEVIRQTESPKFDSVAWFPIGKMLTLRTNGNLQFRDAATAQCNATVTTPGATGAIAFSRCATLMATSQLHPQRSGQRRTELLVWDLASGNVLARIDSDAPISTASFSPYGKAVVFGTATGLAQLWSFAERFDDRSSNAFSLAVADQQLISTDPFPAMRKMSFLERRPEMAHRYVRQFVPPAAVDEVAQLLHQLDSGDFQKREAASRALAALHIFQRWRPMDALRFVKSEEARARLNTVAALYRRQSSLSAADADVLRTIRAVRLLEQIGCKNSVDLLRQLANGKQAAFRTWWAKLALGRVLETVENPKELRK